MAMDRKQHACKHMQSMHGCPLFGGLCVCSSSLSFYLSPLSSCPIVSRRPAFHVLCGMQAYVLPCSVYIQPSSCSSCSTRTMHALVLLQILLLGTCISTYLDTNAIPFVLYTKDGDAHPPLPCGKPAEGQFGPYSKAPGSLLFLVPYVSNTNPPECKRMCQACRIIDATNTTVSMCQACRIIHATNTTVTASFLRDDCRCFVEVTGSDVSTLQK